jgi:hypothetical protein
MREGEYEFIHEFKERISEIMDLQKKHHAIIDSDTEPTTSQGKTATTEPANEIIV